MKKYRFSYRVTIVTITCIVPLFSVLYNNIAIKSGLNPIMGSELFFTVLFINIVLGIAALLHRWPNVYEPIYKKEVKVRS